MHGIAMMRLEGMWVFRDKQSKVMGQLRYKLSGSMITVISSEQAERNPDRHSTWRTGNGAMAQFPVNDLKLNDLKLN